LVVLAMQKVEGSNPFIRLKPSGVRGPAAFQLH